MYDECTDMFILVRVLCSKSSGYWICVIR